MTSIASRIETSPCASSVVRTRVVLATLLHAETRFFGELAPALELARDVSGELLRHGPNCDTSFS
jgi:hypothetical protein